MRIVLTTILSALVALALATPVLAQSDHGVVVHGTVSTAIFQDGLPLALSGAIGYRLNRAFGVELELFSIPDFGPKEVPTPYSARAPFIRHTDNILTAFMTNVRLEAPTTSRRLLPFAVLGGGIVNVSQNFSLSFPASPDPLLFLQSGLNLTNPSFPLTSALLVPYASSALHLGLTIGGGVSVLWTDHLSIDADGRALSLLGEQGGLIGRFGVGVSYRF